MKSQLISLNLLFDENLLNPSVFILILNFLSRIYRGFYPIVISMQYGTKALNWRFVFMEFWELCGIISSKKQI